MVLFVVGIVVVAAVFFMLQRRRRQHVAAAATWPSVQGQITRSAVVTARDSSDHQNTYTPAIAYSYAVAGTAYTGTRVGFGLTNIAHQKAAEDLCARFPVGATVPVFYDPAQPSDSVLDRSA